MVRKSYGRRVRAQVACSACANMSMDMGVDGAHDLSMLFRSGMLKVLIEDVKL